MVDVSAVALAVFSCHQLADRSEQQFKSKAKCSALVLNFFAAVECELARSVFRGKTSMVGGGCQRVTAQPTYRRCRNYMSSVSALPRN